MTQPTAGAAADAAAGTLVRGAAAGRVGARPPGTGRPCDGRRRAGDGGGDDGARGGDSQPRPGGCAKSPWAPDSPDGATAAVVVVAPSKVPSARRTAAARSASDDSDPGTRPCSLPRP